MLFVVLAGCCSETQHCSTCRLLPSVRLIWAKGVLTPGQIAQNSLTLTKSTGLAKIGVLY